MKRTLTAILAIVVIIAVAWSRREGNENAPAADTAAYGNLLAVEMPEWVEGQMVYYTGMTLSFNPEAHLPNWVAWELTVDEVAGTEKRADKFERDPSVPGCADRSDYTNSGFDRGHMAPAGDMKWSQQAMRETFYMTNITPQAHSLNGGAWKTLEEKCRQWARTDSALVIVCGPVLTDAIDERIGSTGVMVPKRFFKVVLAPYANPPRGLGFIMPNSKVEGGMNRAVCTIDEVEAVTGFDFFSSLPDSIEREVESRADLHRWNAAYRSSKAAR